MTAHHGHDEHHQRPSVHTKQHGSKEQRWRRHIQHGRRVDGWTAPTSGARMEGLEALSRLLTANAAASRKSEHVTRRALARRSRWWPRRWP